MPVCSIRKAAKIAAGTSTLATISLTNRLMLLSTQTPNLMVVGNQVEHKKVVL